MNAFADALQSILAAFDRQEIRYSIVGSVASSSYGMPRFTNDVDFVVDFEGVDLKEFLAALQTKFYLDGDGAIEAIEIGRCFNAIHLKAGYKFDFFPLEKGPFGEQQLLRRKFVLSSVPQFEDLEFAITSAEDTVLAKLRWFREGGSVSDRQWHDIAGILSTQQGKLDIPYLKHWAARLELSELLDKALSLGQPSPSPAP